MIPHANDSKHDFEEEELEYAIEKTKQIPWHHRVLLNRPLRVVTALTIAAVLTPLLLYRYIFFPSLDLPPSDGFSFGSCLVSRESRIPCGIGTETADQCHPQCCYNLNNSLCFHRFPSRFSYLTTNWSEEVFLNPRTLITPFASQRSYTNIRLSIDEVSPTHLSITFYHSDQIITGRRIEKKNYDYSVLEPELNIIVNSAQGNIFNLARGPLIATDNIWEISFRLTDEAMFGLGEIPLKETVKIIHNRKGGMSSIPLIYAKLNGSYHGLLIDTVTPTEVIIRGDNQLVVRSITTWGLKFHLFVGPKPVDVMKDVMAAMQIDRSLEYWMLGAHVCSERTSEYPLAEMQTFIDSAKTQRLPFDSHCGTAPVVFDSECNATFVSQVNEGTTLLETAGKKFMPHVSPYIKFKIPEDETTLEVESTTQGEIILKNTRTPETNKEQCFDLELFESYIIRDPESTNFYQGIVDDEEVIYPSYDKINEELMKNLWVYNTNFEGIILENNWPLDESEKDIEETKKHLPYFNEEFEAAFNYTPQWNARLPDLNHTQLSYTTQTIGQKYLYTHNEYGNRFATAFEKIKGSIPMLSSSQWMNGNTIVNRQDIPTSWASLQKELIEASLGGISGHWYWSTPICGDTEHFNLTTQDKLCSKWYMAGTFMPMIKIHSRINMRDPLVFTGTDRAHMITALTRRMSLLPYFYSVLQEGPLLRPMFYQFPMSDDLKELTSQFSVGSDLLIVPNLLPSQTHVHVWLPPGLWYDFWDGSTIDGEEGDIVTMTTTEADFFTMIRGGSILVMQKDVELTAELTRHQSMYSLIIALHCKNSTEDIEPTTTVQSTTAEELSTSTETPITEEVNTTTEALITEEVSTTTESPITEEISTTAENATTEQVITITESLVTEEVDNTTETSTTEQVNITAESTIAEEEVSTIKTTIKEDNTSTIETPDQATDGLKDIKTKTLKYNNVCEATGTFYMDKNMAFTFNANSKLISITAKGDHFQVLCNGDDSVWSNTIREITIYGLDENQNNFDNYRTVSTSINLCQLQTQNEIVFQFVDDL